MCFLRVKRNDPIAKAKSKRVNVPNGFATTASGYRYFIQSAYLKTKLRTLPAYAAAKQKIAKVVL